MYDDMTPHEILFLKLKMLNFPSVYKEHKIIYNYNNFVVDIEHPIKYENEFINYQTENKIKIMLQLIKECTIGNQELISDEFKVIPFQKIKKKRNRKQKNTNVLKFEIIQEKLFM